MLCRVPKIGHSAKPLFAECCTRQRIALGKEWLCRVPQRARHSAKHATRQRHSLPSATLGKERTRQNARQLPAYPAHAVTIFKKNVYRALNLTLGKEALCRVLRPGTRQRPSLPSVRHDTRQSIFVFLNFDFNFFVDLIYCLQAHVKIWDLFITFCYIS